MAPEELTRRSAIATLAGAGAAGLTAPGRALAKSVLAGAAPRAAAAAAGAPYGGGEGADAAPPARPPRLFAVRLGDLPAGLRALRAPHPFDLVGLEWIGPAAAAVQLRTRLRDGRWGRWAAASTLGHAPDPAELSRSAAADRRLIADPVWVAGARDLQLRCATPLRGVTMRFVDVGAGAAASAGVAHAARIEARAAAMPRALPALDAGGGQPPIVARRAWAGTGCHPKVAPEYGAVKLAFVHHTENPNGYSAAEVPAMLRAIFAFHRYVRGWDDIGYNFVVDLFGRVFEARAGGIDEPVVGAQAGGYNAVSTGVAVLGDFQAMRITPAAERALERLLAWKLSLHGVPTVGHVTVRVDPAGAVYSIFPAGSEVTLQRISGHRDADATACPGNALYGQLPAVRRQAARIAGVPAAIEMSLGPAPAPAEPSPQPGPEAEAGGPGAAGEAPAPSQEAGGEAGAPSQGAGGEAGAPSQGAGGEAGAPSQEAGGAGAPAAGAGREAASPPSREGAQGGGQGRAREVVRAMRLSGRLSRLGHGPVAGATIHIQARFVTHRGERVAERTIATVATGEDGSFALPLTVTSPKPVKRRAPAKRGKGRRRRGSQRRVAAPVVPITPLRAIHLDGDGAPATISEPLDVRGKVRV